MPKLQVDGVTVVEIHQATADRLLANQGVVFAYPNLMLFRSINAARSA